MGILFACCQRSSSQSDLLTPSLDTRRLQQAEAAERRIRQQEARGIRDPERLRERLQRIEALERRQILQSIQQDSHKLTWSID